MFLLSTLNEHITMIVRRVVCNIPAWGWLKYSALFETPPAWKRNQQQSSRRLPPAYHHHCLIRQ